eukprot:3385628-Rhodomonas_salina.1
MLNRISSFVCGSTKSYPMLASALNPRYRLMVYSVPNGACALQLGVRQRGAPPHARPLPSDKRAPQLESNGGRG